MKQLVSLLEKNQELPYYQCITMLLLSKVALKMTINV